MHTNSKYNKTILKRKNNYHLFKNIEKVILGCGNLGGFQLACTELFCFDYLFWSVF
jgi:hypothetical protein